MRIADLTPTRPRSRRALDRLGVWLRFRCVFVMNDGSEVGARCGFGFRRHWFRARLCLFRLCILHLLPALAAQPDWQARQPQSPRQKPQTRQLERMRDSDPPTRRPLASQHLPQLPQPLRADEFSTGVVSTTGTTSTEDESARAGFSATLTVATLEASASAAIYAA